MREPRQNVGVDAHRHRHRGGVRQPGLRRFEVFGRHPFAVTHAVQMPLVHLDAQMVALVRRKCAVLHADHGDGVPFKALRLVDGHQHHVDGRVRNRGVVVGGVAKRIHPGDERTQAWRALRGDLLHVGVDEFHHRIQRRFGQRRVFDGQRRGIVRFLAACSVRAVGRAAVLHATHTVGKHHVDVEVQRADGGMDRFRQRMTDHLPHLAQHRGRAQHRPRPVPAEPVFDEFRQIVAQHHVDEEHRVGNLVAVFAHHGADARFVQPPGFRFRIMPFPGVGRLAFRGAFRRDDAGGHQRAVPVCRVHRLRDAGERLQVVGIHRESRCGEQTHQRGAVGVVADHVQQREDVPHLRTFQQRRLPDDQRGQSGPLKRVLVSRHLRFGTKQHRHVRTMVLRAMLDVVRGRRVQRDRVFGESHDGVDLLPERRIGEHADRAFGGVGDVGERRHVDFPHQRAASAARGQSQWFREVVGRFEHHARVASRHGQRVGLVGRAHAEIMLQHAERARAGAAPCVDGLEGIADRVHRAASRGVHVEQRGQQRRLRGGGVLVFVEQHMRVASAVGGAD